MTAQHTPGPWHTRPNDPWAVYADAEATRTICDIRNRGSQISEANARLIAAAPELLEALKDMAGLGPHALVRKWGKAQDKALATIAKAEGRP